MVAEKEQGQPSLGQVFANQGTQNKEMEFVFLYFSLVSVLSKKPQ